MHLLTLPQCINLCHRAKKEPPDRHVTYFYVALIQCIHLHYYTKNVVSSAFFAARVTCAADVPLTVASRPPVRPLSEISIS